MPKKRAGKKIEEILIENFVNLQKALTNLVIKFDSLSEQISKLLQVFEISAKSFADKQKEKEAQEKEFLDKLNTLLEQNKIIAKGITLIEEKTRENEYGKSFTQNIERKPLY